LTRIYIFKIDTLHEKLQQMVQDGPRKLLVIADFDHTLTTYRLSDGEPTQSCHGIMGNSHLMHPDFRREMMELFLHYYPIEVSPALTHDEKEPYMIEW